MQKTFFQNIRDPEWRNNLTVWQHLKLIVILGTVVVGILLLCAFLWKLMILIAIIFAVGESIFFLIKRLDR